MKNKTLKNLIQNRTLLLMVLPSIILIIMFNYVPIYGVTIAFKDYNFTKGILGSEWVGFENFKFLIASKNLMWRLLRNTIGYWLLFNIVGTTANLILAFALDECTRKRFVKYSHTMMIAPTFISYVAVTFIVTAFLDDSVGLVNKLLTTLGMETVQWYSSPGKWPGILLLVNLWKGTGYGCILYLSALTGMDREMLEAAELDGADKLKQIFYIKLPMLLPMICILQIMGLGGILSSNTGLFYQVTKNIGLLYPTTQTIDSYVLDAIMGGSNDWGVTGAVSLFQSSVGTIIVIATNLIVRRWEPDYALF